MTWQAREAEGGKYRAEMAALKAAEKIGSAGGPRTRRHRLHHALWKERRCNHRLPHDLWSGRPPVVAELHHARHSRGDEMAKLAAIRRAAKEAEKKKAQQEKEEVRRRWTN
jgi:hypothetical protein